VILEIGHMRRSANQVEYWAMGEEGSGHSLGKPLDQMIMAQARAAVLPEQLRK